VKRLIIGMLLLLLPSSVCAELTPRPKARPAGDLAILVTASDSLRYIEDWVSKSSDKPITIRRITEIKPGQLVYCAFLVTGLTGDKDSNYKFIVNFRLIDPNGKTVFEVPRYAKGNGTITLKPVFVMADPALDLVLEASDPAGLYQVEGTVEDLVSGKNVTDTYRIILKK
jgi:hypothetical protein